MQEDEPRIATVGIPAHRSLLGSRLAIRCFMACSVFVAGLSSIMFVYQVTLTDEFGDLYRNQPGAWPNLLGLLLRSVVGTVLAWVLWGYLRAIKKSINAAHGEADEMFRALARWWNILAMSALVMLSYGVWVAFFSTRPETTRPLSRRFDAMRPESTTVKVEFRIAEYTPHEGLIETNAADSPYAIFMHHDPLLTNKDIAEARVVKDQLENPAVEVKFVPAGQQKLYKTMEANPNKLLAILIDGRVVTAPIIREPITSGQAIITGGFTRDEAERIARGLSGRE